MQPHAVLEYERLRQPMLRRIREWTRQHWRSLGIVAGLALVVYGVTYCFVRESHTKFWFDKEAEVRVPYTLFDAYTRGELCLYVAFWPACAADRAMTGRTFEYDKW